MGRPTGTPQESPMAFWVTPHIRPPLMRPMFPAASTHLRLGGCDVGRWSSQRTSLGLVSSSIVLNASHPLGLVTVPFVEIINKFQNPCRGSVATSWSGQVSQCASTG